MGAADTRVPHKRAAGGVLCPNQARLDDIHDGGPEHHCGAAACQRCVHVSRAAPGRRRPFSDLPHVPSEQRRANRRRAGLPPLSVSRGPAPQRRAHPRGPPHTLRCRSARIREALLTLLRGLYPDRPPEQVEAFTANLEPVLLDLGMAKGCTFSVVGIDSNDTKTEVLSPLRLLVFRSPIG